MSNGECYTQSVKADESVTLLGGSQVHLQPAPLFTNNMYNFFKKNIHDDN